MHDFRQGVINIVKKIPKGKVVSYGQVALYLGVPRAAREVGWVLNEIGKNPLAGPEQIPWWRVVNNSGRISIKGSRFTANDQKNILIKEGINVNSDLTLDMSKYRFIPDSQFIINLKLDPLYLEMVLDKFPYSKHLPKTS